MVVCTFYSPKIGFEEIIEQVKQTYPKSEITVNKVDNLEVAEIQVSRGLLRASSKFKVSYRQRLEPSYQLIENSKCPLTANLMGLYGFVSSIPSKNEKVKGQLLNKIQTLNSEFSIIQESGVTKNLNKLIAFVASRFKTVLFVQPSSIISKASSQHFLDERLNLVLDLHGNSEVKNLYFEIDSKYGYDISGEREAGENEIHHELPVFRKEALVICKNAGFKPASSLPTEWDRQLRPAIEIASRLNAIKALVLWLLVPQENLPDDKIQTFVDKNQLKVFMTDDEVQILNSSREDDNLRNGIGWKFENAWPLAWYFGFNEPEILGTMMSGELMQQILTKYSCPLDESVNDWTKKQEIRSESEVIAKEDLFYCLHNAVRSAQMGGKTVPDQFDPIGGGGVIHERRHSLTWMLSNGIDWKDTDLST